MDLYQQFIHQSRYARFDYTQGRRETWPETVGRYFDFFQGHLLDKHGYRVPTTQRQELETAVLDLEVMPSMRALMTAGEALRRTNVAGFNCAFMAVNSLRAFDEAMYVLLCGTGVGYSVRRKHVAKLPTIPDHFVYVHDPIVVEDSKEGWASAFRELLGAMVAGCMLPWDVSGVRPAGAPLKTFGGRASGPAPLVDLFKFAQVLVAGAAGRQLTPLECHDLMCKIGDIVVVGGVRRSAMISISDIDDEDMRLAKSGEWWRDHGHRRLANNTAFHEGRPELGTFLREWAALYESRSGERGIFNHAAALAQLPVRRDPDHEFGLNPCVSADTWVNTNDGPRQVKDLIDNPFDAVVDGQAYKSAGFWKTGTKRVLKVVTDRGYEVKVTPDHKILTGFGWQEAGRLRVGDELVLGNNRGRVISGDGFGLGWLLGLMVGDGGHNPDKYPSYLRFWGEDAEDRANAVFDEVAKLPEVRSPIPLSGPVNNGGIWSITTRRLDRLADPYLGRGTKEILPALEAAPDGVVRGFLRGFFDTDGTVLDGDQKGVSVRLAQSDLPRLKAVQRMLARFGIVSTIYRDRHEAGPRRLPDGNGGHKDYDCKATHELCVSKDNLPLFHSLVYFSRAHKAEKLDDIVMARSGKRGFYAEGFRAKVVSVEEDGVEDVFDCTVEEVHRFEANGIIVHNCAEIILRSKQMCNLSEVVARPGDTRRDLLRKVGMATTLGTWQSTLTDFPYLSDGWRLNTAEERLLGVSLTGIVDNETTRLADRGDLEMLRWCATLENKAEAETLGIPASAAVTCVKPSGTVSQLCNSGSGINEWHSEHFIRNVRNDVKDPVSQLMRDAGVPCELDRADPTGNTLVFSFPRRAPEGAVVRDDWAATEKLNLWLRYKRHFCEHNPSTTVNVREDEWMGVGDWVWRHFDEVVGIAFLPFSDHVYEQAPYQDCTETEYREAVARMPERIEWSDLRYYEEGDQTKGSQTLACVGGTCELV